MRLIGREILQAFATKHSEATAAITAWILCVEVADWKKFADVKSTYITASWIPPNRVVFNLKGNNYRLVTVVVLVASTVEVRWIGTHAQYDKIDASHV